jgi:hypothetical protein
MIDELSFPMANGEEWQWLEEKSTSFGPTGPDAAVQFSVNPVPQMGRILVHHLDSYAVPFSAARLRTPARPVFLSQMLTLSRCNAWIAHLLGDVEPATLTTAFHNRLRSDETLHVKCKLALARQEARQVIGEFQIGGVVQRRQRLIPVFTATVVIHRRL